MYKKRLASRLIGVEEKRKCAVIDIYKIYKYMNI